MAATGTLAVTDVVPLQVPHLPVQKVTLAWTSDASGNVDQTTPAAYGGEILRVVFVPGTGGNQPSNNYTVTLLDAQGLDLLSGQGASLSNTTTTEICPTVPAKDGTTTSTTTRGFYDRLELVVSGGGNAKQGSLILYLR